MKRKGGPGWSVTSTCERCGQPEDRCRCHTTAPPGKTGPRVARLGMERRRGKPVTVCRLEGLAEPELRELAAELRRTCGAGGTTREDAVEIQGDHRGTVREILAGRGLRVKG